jgi:hypothetical protein
MLDLDTLAHHCVLGAIQKQNTFHRMGTLLVPPALRTTTPRPLLKAGLQLGIVCEVDGGKPFVVFNRSKREQSVSSSRLVKKTAGWDIQRQRRIIKGEHTCPLRALAGRAPVPSLLKTLPNVTLRRSQHKVELISYTSSKQL